MRIRGGTAPHRLLALGVAALCGLALGGCFSSSGSSDARPTPRPPSSIPVTVAQPHARGPFPVRLQPGLSILTPDRCRPAAHRVCSVDATHSWAPVDPTTSATVTDVSTRLAPGHVSWTTVVTFSPDDHTRLERWSRGAASVGGEVLVLAPDRTVLAALPPSTVRGNRAVLADLDKDVAWGVVEGFSRD